MNKGGTADTYETVLAQGTSRANMRETEAMCVSMRVSVCVSVCVSRGRSTGRRS